MRRRLPEGVKMYTGDDFNYPELIAGDDGRILSHALLGHFRSAGGQRSARAIGATGCMAMSAGFHATLDPTVPLARA